MKAKNNLLLFLLLVTLSLASCQEKAHKNFEKYKDLTPVKAAQIKNVIFLISDGGGLANLDLANKVKTAGGFLPEAKNPNSSTITDNNPMLLKNYMVGNITTYSSNQSITDSAASGTALSTGFKTNNGTIGLDADNKPVATVLEAAQLLGKSVGLVSTIRWNHATPAAFGSHTESRDNNRIIGEQMINQELDVDLGTNFAKSLYGTEDYATSRGYKLIKNKTDLTSVNPGDKIWGGIAGEMPYDIELKDSQPSLPLMTNAAIKALSDNKDGFFLMVEASHVDIAAAQQDAVKMVSEYLAFDASFKVALDFAKQRTDTIVIATSDHDTGGLVLPKGEDLDSAVNDIRVGTNPSNLEWSSSGGHTNRNVGVFMYLPDGINQITGFSSMADKGDTPLNRESKSNDNTVFANYIGDLWGISMSDATKKLFVDVTDQGNYDSEKSLFTFNDGRSMAANQSWYTNAKGKTVHTHGQVSVYSGEHFYVPAIVIS